MNTSLEMDAGESKRPRMILAVLTGVVNVNHDLICKLM